MWRMLQITLLGLLVCNANAAEVKLAFDSVDSSEHFGRVTLDLPYDLNTAINKGQLKKVLSLRVGKLQVSNSRLPAIAGRYSIVDGNLIFEPLFAPESGQSYTVEFNAEAFNRLFTHYPKLTKPLYQLTEYITNQDEYLIGKVTKVYPQTDVLPQNILRFYVYFSQPMAFDNPYDYLSVINQDNEPVYDAFVEFRQGLWDQSRTRLTVFIHPGRIKRGVGPNVKQGPVFKQGQRYQLKIDKRFKTLDGTPMNEDFSKSFTITKPIYQKLNPKSWQLDLPDINSQQKLVLIPERILDPHIAEQMITLVNRKTGNIVAADINFDAKGLNLLITPETPWQMGDYQIQLESKLEDLSGNTPAWAFDSETPVVPSTHQVNDLSILFSL